MNNTTLPEYHYDREEPAPGVYTRMFLFLAQNTVPYYILFSIGAAWLIYNTLSAIYGIYACFLRRRLNFSARYGAGTWVVVTGASDGIGKGFCFAFAKMGFNVVLIARNQEKLKGVQSEIAKQSPDSKTKIIIADFTHSAEEGFFEKIVEQLKGLDISILINNVGVEFTQYIEFFDEQNLKDEVIVNCLPMSMLLRKLLPQLNERKLKSAVINVSSFAGINPLAFYATYSATKTFNDYLSRSVSYEVTRKVDMLSFMPLFVSTKMNNKKVGLETISVEDAVNGCLDDLGRTSRTHGHWKHKLQAYITSWIPLPVTNFLALTFGKKLVEKAVRQSSKTK